MLRVIMCVVLTACSTSAPSARCETCDEGDQDAWTYLVEYGQQEYPDAELVKGACRRAGRQRICESTLRLASNATVYLECHWNVSCDLLGECFDDLVACTGYVATTGVRCQLDQCEPGDGGDIPLTTEPDQTRQSADEQYPDSSKVYAGCGGLRNTTRGRARTCIVDIFDSETKNWLAFGCTFYYSDDGGITGLSCYIQGSVSARAP